MVADTATSQPPKPASRRRNKKSTTEAKVGAVLPEAAAARTPSIEEGDGRADEELSSFGNPHIKELQK